MLCNDVHRVGTDHIAPLVVSTAQCTELLPGYLVYMKLMQHCVSYTSVKKF